MPTGRDSGNLHSEESVWVEEELNLISIDVLSPHYKELVSASIHMAPPHFHESVRCCSQKKLLERALADNNWVSHPSLF